MIIENPDALRTWLTACLEPKCDADPAALAKYVMALVKKDKPESELRDICLDQLDVFLQKGTKPFVDLLFETLSDKSYLKQTPVVVEPSQNGPPIEAEKPVTSIVVPAAAVPLIPMPGEIVTGTSVNGTVAPPVVNVPIATPTFVAKPPSVVSVVSPLNQGATNAILLASNVTLPSKSEGKRSKSGNESDERETKRGRIRSKSRSKSPSSRSSSARNKTDIRDSDERRNRRFTDDDRRRRNFQNRRYDNRYRDFRRGGGGNQNANDRDRERDRDFRLQQRSKDRSNSNAGRNDRNASDRGGNKSQSRSRSNSPWKRTRSWSRSRSNSRSRSPSHSRSRSWSRSRERTRGGAADRDSHGAAATTSNSTAANEHGDKDYRNTSGGSGTTTTTTTTPTAAEGGTANAKTAPAAAGNNPTAAADAAFRSKQARRCRDYDEKGYCMRGDLCAFDHGMDPVVLEDVSVLGFGPNSGTVPPPPNHETFLPEPYNPEAPGMERPNRIHHNAFWNHPPPGPPGTGPPMRPMGPRPHMFHSGPQQRTRELIGVPTVDNAELSSSGGSSTGPKSVVNRMVLEPLQAHSDTSNNNSATNMVRSSMGYGGNRRGGGHDGGFRRRVFDYNRLAPRKMTHHSAERCTLELRKVPRHQNTISELNTHFSKFGAIVNLQVCFGGDPEAALIQFSSHNEANAAYRCTDAVLNNRFIKVFWHNKENQNNPGGAPGATPQGVAGNNAQSNPNFEPLGTAAVDNKANTTDQEGSVINTTEAGAEVKTELGIPPIQKPSIKERLGIANVMTKVNNVNKKITKTTTLAEDGTEKVVLFTPAGNLSRTVFNPAALKKNNVPANLAIARKTSELQKKDSLKKKLEVQTKRQEFIQIYVQQQKLLVEKLEKCKTDKDKTNIKETLNSLSKTIEQLQAEVRKEATEISTLNKSIMQAAPKSKTEPVLLSKAEKELLDAEMDLYNKQHRGDDTTDLKKKVFDLKQQAKALGLLDSSGQLRTSLAAGFPRGGLSLRYRGRGGRGGAAMVPRKLTSFDRRPKKLLVEGHAEGDQNNLLMHFSQYAQIERLEMVENGALVTFKTRRDAEKVITLGMKYNDRILKLSWFVDPAFYKTEASEAGLDIDSQINDENLDQSEDEDNILLGDDEEEEDSEARSWRR